MPEQSSPDIKKHSRLKTVAKRIAPVIIGAVTVLSSDSNASLPTPVISNIIPLEQGKKETEKNLFTPQVTLIDAGLSTPKEGIIQNEFFSNEELVKRALGDSYLSKEQLRQEFGRPINWMSLDVGKSAITTDKYKQVLTHAFIERYFGHGNQVANVMEKVWSEARLQSSGIELIPLQKMLDASSIKEIHDLLGNKGVSISFDPQRIIGLLKTDTNRVVNMSFQVGDVDLFLEEKYIFIPQPEPIYENALQGNDENTYIGAVGIKVTNDKTIYVDAQGKEIKPTTPDELRLLKQQKQEEAKRKAAVKETDSPLIKIVGAYDYDKARENLPKLFAVANAYPDKLFFAAAGNEAEDFEEIIKELKDQPKNLIIVGQWTDGYGPTQKVFGADIYVDNRGLGIGDGSSFSTPVLAAFAETLFRQGLSQDEVLEKIKTNSHQEDYDLDLPDVKKKGSVMVFDLTF